MGIQETIKKREAKVAQAQATQAEVQPQAAPIGPNVQPAFDTEVLRQIIRVEVQALRAEPLDMDAIREVIRAELQAVPLVPAPVDMQAMQTMIRTEVCDIYTALQLLIEVIQQTQAVCDDDEQLPTAAPRSLDDEESREPTTFPAQESEEESEEEPVMPPPARSESPIRRLRRPGPDIIALKNIPRVGLRRWEPLA